jgi:hypothetical protein
VSLHVNFFEYFLGDVTTGIKFFVFLKGRGDAAAITIFKKKTSRRATRQCIKFTREQHISWRYINHRQQIKICSNIHITMRGSREIFAVPDFSYHCTIFN